MPISTAAFFSRWTNADICCEETALTTWLLCWRIANQVLIWCNWQSVEQTLAHRCQWWRSSRCRRVKRKQLGLHSPPKLCLRRPLFLYRLVKGKQIKIWTLVTVSRIRFFALAGHCLKLLFDSWYPWMVNFTGTYELFWSKDGFTRQF